MNYVEKFTIKNGKTVFNVAISEEPGPNKFKPWIGGCGVSTAFPTIQDARELCFEYVVEEIKSKIEEHKQKIEELNSLKTMLGNDVFNMARFKNF